MAYCGICDMGFISESALESHKTDKKHLSRSEEYQRQIFENAYSVHVTGFSDYILKAHLYAYFASFGRVLDVAYIDRKNAQPPFAFVKFENLNVASQVLRHKHHYLYGQPLKVQTKRLKFRNPNRLEVSNLYSANVQALGSVDAQNRRDQHRRSFQKRKDIDWSTQGNITEMIPNLLKHLLEKNTIDEQMMLIYEELKLTDADLAERQRFCKLLHKIMEPYFPGCSVELFGSSINGFGVKGCDIDVFLDISHLMQPVPVPVEPVPNSVLKKMLRKNTKPTPMKEFLQLTPYQRIKYLLITLSKKLNANYCNFFPIPSNTCPIIKFNHKLSDITCDFSIQNKGVLCNSHLMKFFSEYDSRIKPLAFTIRMWAKCKNIAIAGGSSLSSYTLTLMIFFFLQNTEPPVLPSVQQVMDVCNEKEEIMIDGIRCSYPLRPPQTVLPRSKNKDLIGDLLVKFFSFFIDFNYDTSVISPRTGKILLHSEIDNQESFKVSPICVQDPYHLERNTSFYLTDKFKEDFIRELSLSKSKLSEIPTDSTSINLASLLTIEESQVGKRKKSRHGSKLDGPPYCFSLSIKVFDLKKELSHSVQPFGDTAFLWCKILCSFLQIILKELLLVECCVEHEDLSLKELLNKAAMAEQDRPNKDLKQSFSLSQNVAIAVKDETIEKGEASQITDVTVPIKTIEKGEASQITDVTVAIKTIEKGEASQITDVAVPIKTIEKGEASQITDVAVPIKTIEKGEASQITDVAVPIKTIEKGEASQITDVAVPIKTIEKGEASQITDVAVPIKTIEKGETSQINAVAVPIKTIEKEETSQNTDVTVPIKTIEKGETSQINAVAVPIKTIEKEETSQNTDVTVPIAVKAEPLKKEANQITQVDGFDISCGPFKSSDQNFPKRQSDVYICGDVKRICLKDGEMSEENKESPNFLEKDSFPSSEEMDVSGATCHEGVSNTETGIRNNEENVKTQKTSESNICKVKPDGNETDPAGVKEVHSEDGENQPEANPLLKVRCMLRHDCWQNRKKVRQKLLSMWSGNELEMEKKISEHIVASEPNVLSLRPLTSFRLSVIPETNSSVYICVDPIASVNKTVSVFYQFLISFIPRMVSSHFVKWCVDTFPKRPD